MEGVWNRLVPIRKRRMFFELSLIEWIYGNLGDNAKTKESTWDTLFALSIWWAWKWRCANVFGANKTWRDRVKFLKDMANEVSRASSVEGKSLNQTRLGHIEKQIGWSKPREGWFKLNTDGASRGNPGLATAGGVLRDNHGEWRGGFSFNIGICSAPLAELWGVYYGLCIAWERKVARLEIEVDSAVMVGFFKTGIQDTHSLFFLVRLCYGFISRDWRVRISHVYREANRLVDGLANYAFSLSFGFHFFDSVPDTMRLILLEDASGVTIPRRMRL